MKITVRELQKIIKEEIEYALLEQIVELDEGMFDKLKKYAAGAFAGLSLMGATGNTAQAAQNTNQPMATADSAIKASISDDDKHAMVGLIHSYMKAKFDTKDLSVKMKVSEVEMDAIKFVRGKGYTGTGGTSLVKGAKEIMEKTKVEKPEVYKQYVETGKKISVQ
jgi:hypothetical protein